jgi:hypothetical protein
MSAANPQLAYFPPEIEPPSSAPIEAKQEWLRARMAAQKEAGLARARRAAEMRVPRHQLADMRCTRCARVDGIAVGYRILQRGLAPQICGCVFRSAFRAVMGKRAAILREYPPGVQLERMPVKGGGFSFTYSIPAAEYLADLTLSARRRLTAAQWPLFDLHYFHGMDWKGCLPKLARMGLDSGKDKGNFFHECYRVEEAMGREWLEIGMAPAGRYFRGRAAERGTAVDKRDERLFFSMVRTLMPEHHGRQRGYGKAMADGPC